MQIGEWARNRVYWLADQAQGGSVKYHLKDIEMLWDNLPLMQEKRAERLQHLLQHAVRTTDYYRQWDCRLEDFPVVEKETIRKNTEAFLSHSFQRERLVVRKTSGSYGMPMSFYFSPEKRARQVAEIIHFGRWVGYDVGLKHAYVKAQHPVDGKSMAKLWMQNEMLMDCGILSEEWLEKQRRVLKGKEIRCIIGYASGVTALAEYLSACGDQPEMFGVEGALVYAEPFSEAMRETVHRAFGCPVIARYSTNETGVLACECPEHHEYHLNEASYVVELLALDSNQPVGPGTVGRVVVTDLFSHAMPLIRYDLGDLAVLGEQPVCGRFTPVLERLDGRMAARIYDTVGRPVHYLSLSAQLCDSQNVLQFQFIQEEAKRYILKLVPLPGYDGEQELRFRERLKGLLGMDAEISLARVDQIPPLRSGKRPLFINNSTVRTPHQAQVCDELSEGRE